MRTELFPRAEIAREVEGRGIGALKPGEHLFVGSVGPIELRAILGRVEVRTDAEITLRNGLDLHRERLRLFALPFGRPFSCDLRDGDEGR